MVLEKSDMTITLATASQTRIKMLANAGIEVAAMPARIDEATIKASLLAEGAKPNDIVDTLAEMKTQRVASKTQGFVIGSDQILVCDGTLYDKASDMDVAKTKLLALQGKPHNLLSAAVIYEDGKPVWRNIGRAQMIMRAMGEDEIEKYLEAEGDAVLQSVGCYFLEGRGAQLFTRVQGDYFSVLGFPLLDVLGYLRTRGVI